MLYRAHFLTHAGERFGEEMFHAEDDEKAIKHARQKLSSPWGMGHEIWEGSRLVHREVYE